jgi:hypothetical protein
VILSPATAAEQAVVAAVADDEVAAKLAVQLVGEAVAVQGVV